MKDTDPVRTANRIIGEVIRIPMSDQGYYGYFFIRGTDNRDYFAHRTELKQDLHIEELQIGQRLSFIPVTDTRGWRAHEIYRPPSTADARKGAE